MAPSKNKDNPSSPDTVALHPNSIVPSKALLIGINYVSWEASQLRGCWQDVQDAYSFLARIGTPKESVHVLTDEIDPFTPTKRAILEQFKWLKEGAKAGDVLFIHFSGHGVQLPHAANPNGRTSSKAICPIDYRDESSSITGEEFYASFRNLNDVNLTVVYDCCHTGAMPDLESGSPSNGPKYTSVRSVNPKYLSLNKKQNKKKEKKEKENRNKTQEVVKREDQNTSQYSSCGLYPDYAIGFAACGEWQTTTDTEINGRPCGAFSFFLYSLLASTVASTTSGIALIESVGNSMKDALAFKDLQTPRIFGKDEQQLLPIFARFLTLRCGDAAVHDRVIEYQDVITLAHMISPKDFSDGEICNLAEAWPKLTSMLLQEIKFRNPEDISHTFAEHAAEVIGLQKEKKVGTKTEAITSVQFSGSTDFSDSDDEDTLSPEKKDPNASPYFTVLRYNYLLVALLSKCSSACSRHIMQLCSFTSPRPLPFIHRSLSDPNKFRVLCGSIASLSVNKKSIVGRPMVLFLGARARGKTTLLISLLDRAAEQQAAFELHCDRDRGTSPTHDGMVELLVRPNMPDFPFVDSRGTHYIVADMHGNAATLPTSLVKYAISLANVVVLQTSPDDTPEELDRLFAMLPPPSLSNFVHLARQKKDYQKSLFDWLKSKIALNMWHAIDKANLTGCLKQVLVDSGGVPQFTYANLQSVCTYNAFEVDDTVMQFATTLDRTLPQTPHGLDCILVGSPVSSASLKQHWFNHSYKLVGTLVSEERALLSADPATRDKVVIAIETIRIKQAEDPVSIAMKQFCKMLQGINFERDLTLFLHELSLFVEASQTAIWGPYKVLEEELDQVKKQHTSLVNETKNNNNPNLPKKDSEIAKLAAELERIRTKKQDLSRQIFETNIGLEHFCREICQLWYVAQCFEERKTPVPHLSSSAYLVLIARLLRAGFPIEVMDGDNNYVPMKFLTALFSYLNTTLSHENSSLKVVTVMGTQSSHKSTLLNTMFGSRFGVSAGRCTRGIQACLVADNSQKGKQGWVLILDTEGLESNEALLEKEMTATTMNDNSSQWRHDHQLALFAIYLSHAVIINTKGEMDRSFSEMLQLCVYSMVLLRSTMPCPELYLVLRNIEEQDSENKLNTAQDSLEEVLRGAVAIFKEHHPNEKDLTVEQVIYMPRKNYLKFPSAINSIGTFNSRFSYLCRSLLENILVSPNRHQHFEDFLAWATQLHTTHIALQEHDFAHSFRNLTTYNHHRELGTKRREYMQKVDSQYIVLYEELLAQPITNADTPTSVVAKYTASIQIDPRITRIVEEFIQKVREQPAYNAWVDTAITELEQYKARRCTTICDEISLASHSKFSAKTQSDALLQMRAWVSKHFDNLRMQDGEVRYSRLLEQWENIANNLRADVQTQPLTPSALRQQVLDSVQRVYNDYMANYEVPLTSVMLDDPPFQGDGAMFMIEATQYWGMKKYLLEVNSETNFILWQECIRLLFQQLHPIITTCERKKLSVLFIQSAIMATRDAISFVEQDPGVFKKMKASFPPKFQAHAHRHVRRAITQHFIQAESVYHDQIDPVKKFESKRDATLSSVMSELNAQVDDFARVNDVIWPSLKNQLLSMTVDSVKREWGINIAAEQGLNKHKLRRYVVKKVTAGDVQCGVKYLTRWGSVATEYIRAKLHRRTDKEIATLFKRKLSSLACQLQHHIQIWTPSSNTAAHTQEFLDHLGLFCEVQDFPYFQVRDGAKVKEFLLETSKECATPTHTGLKFPFDVNHWLDEFVPSFLHKIFKCLESCPLCGAKCDEETTLDTGTHKGSKHSCEIHQISGMMGCHFEGSHEALTSICSDNYALNNDWITKTGIIPFRTMIQSPPYNTFNFENSVCATTSAFAKFMWVHVGPTLCVLNNVKYTCPPAWVNISMAMALRNE